MTVAADFLNLSGPELHLPFEVCSAIQINMNYRSQFPGNACINRPTPVFSKASPCGAVLIQIESRGSISSPDSSLPVLSEFP